MRQRIPKPIWIQLSQGEQKEDLQLLEALQGLEARSKEAQRSSQRGGEGGWR